MDLTSTSYEARCPHCDVSFPVETRKCLHCGGRTVRPEQLSMVESYGAPEDASFEIFPDPTEEGPAPIGGELEAPEESISTGRSLLRSLGGFVWIIVLIGFTLARNCGGE